MIDTASNVKNEGRYPVEIFLCNTDASKTRFNEVKFSLLDAKLERLGGFGQNMTRCQLFKNPDAAKQFVPFCDFPSLRQISFAAQSCKCAIALLKCDLTLRTKGFNDAGSRSK